MEAHRCPAMQDALPACDQGIAQKLGGTITPEEYGAMVVNGVRLIFLLVEF